MTEGFLTGVNRGLFDRKVELIIQRERESFVIQGLRIEFRVQKFAGSMVDNRANIRVFNLQASVRALVNKRLLDISAPPYTTVFLSAGYNNVDGAPLIYRGVIIDGANYRRGPNWISEFTAYTAAQQKNAALCDSSCTFLLTPPRVIMETLFQKLNYFSPSFSSEAAAILSLAQPTTRAFTGRIDQALETFLARYNLRYTLDDDGPIVIQVGSASNPLDPTAAIPVVSPDTGLIGTPRITNSGVEIRSLLNPDLKVFKRFVLNSATTDGSLTTMGNVFTATKVEHNGSNRDNDFFTEVTGQYFPRIPFQVPEPEAPAGFTVNPVSVGTI